MSVGRADNQANSTWLIELVSHLIESEQAMDWPGTSHGLAQLLLANPTLTPLLNASFTIPLEFLPLWKWLAKSVVLVKCFLFSFQIWRWAAAVSAFDVAVLGIGSRTVPKLEGVAAAGAEEEERVLFLFLGHSQILHCVWDWFVNRRAKWPILSSCLNFTKSSPMANNLSVIRGFQSYHFVITGIFKRWSTVVLITSITSF